MKLFSTTNIMILYIQRENLDSFQTYWQSSITIFDGMDYRTLSKKHHAVYIPFVLKCLLLLTFESQNNVYTYEWREQHFAYYTKVHQFTSLRRPLYWILVSRAINSSDMIYQATMHVLLLQFNDDHVFDAPIELMLQNSALINLFLKPHLTRL